MRGREQPIVKSAYIDVVLQDANRLGFVQRAKAAIEARSRSATVLPRSASTTCSEASGNRARRDPNANETVVAEQADTVALARDPTVSTERVGRRGKRP